MVVGRVSELAVAPSGLSGGGMKVYDFKVILEPEPDGGYVVSCPSLRDCYSEGETVEKALVNIKEAIELVLEDMKAHGEPIPDPSQVLVGSVVITQ